MSELLDLSSLHSQMELEYGSGNDQSPEHVSPEEIMLIDPRGLLMNLGWYENSKKSTGGRDHFALVSYPEIPRNLYHNVALEQVNRDSEARLIEYDSYDYLNFIYDFPTIIRKEALDASELDEAIRKYMIGSFVVSAELGSRLYSALRKNPRDIAGFKEYGLYIIAAGDVVAEIDEATLDGYTEVGTSVKL